MTTWRERVVAAAARGRFTVADWKLAKSWVTCAVGEQHALHPELGLYGTWGRRPPAIDFDMGPEDLELSRLGDEATGFYAAVRENDIDRASDLLDAIEDRVLVLKREKHGDD